MTTRAIPKRQINFLVTETVYRRLQKLAEERSIPASTYARQLFEAAYAARHAATNDRILDVTVAATVLLMGSGVDDEQIAEALQCSKKTVQRTRQAFTQALDEAREQAA